MSHIRSSSVSGRVRPLGLGGGGVVVQEFTVEKRVAYLVDWSGVRDGGGGGFDVSEGKRKGVFTDVEEGLSRFSGLGWVGLVPAGGAPLTESAICILGEPLLSYTRGPWGGFRCALPSM